MYFLFGQTDGERKVVFWKRQGGIQGDIVPQEDWIVIRD